MFDLEAEYIVGSDFNIANFIIEVTFIFAVIFAVLVAIFITAFILTVIIHKAQRKINKYLFE
jgi:hypothetical protein